MKRKQARPARSNTLMMDATDGSGSFSGYLALPPSGRGPGLVIAQDLPEDLAEELGWGSQMLLTASAAAVVLVSWQGQCLLRRGLLTEGTFVPGDICQRAQSKGAAISLVDLRLYPGREEFASLLPGLPAVIVQPLGRDGLVVLGGWSPRCFSRSDLTWLDGWSLRIRAKLEALSSQTSGPGFGPEGESSGSEPDSPDC